MFINYFVKGLITEKQNTEITAKYRKAALKIKKAHKYTT
jgi:hypothetical protein